jgi:hypothetical protein
VSVGAGSVNYSIGKDPVVGCGLCWTEADLDSALRGPVAEIIFDYDGQAKVSSLLASAATTEFDSSHISRILQDPTVVENWRVGEAMAEAYVRQHRSCNFPWPDGRDERKKGSSLPGADLVGFQQNGQTVRFVLGEVKTSAEEKYPPQVMYGRHGLKQQLEDLRDNVSIRDGLVKYLAHRAVNADWQQRFIEASRRYITDNTDVQLFGLLIRDVVPNKDDLDARIEKLSKDCPLKMNIELIAIYLLAGSIAKLGTKVVNPKKNS